MLEIRRAVYEDIPNIMRFMDEHWKPGNILAKNRDFFEWQFVDDGKVNMFIGIDDTDDKIYGMIGAVVYNHKWDPDVSGCTWQVIKSENPMLGLELSDYMIAALNIRFNFAAGISEKAVKINELKKIGTTEMDHYYRLADREDYRIAEIEEKIIPKARETGYCLERLHSVEEMKRIVSEDALLERILSKDYAYIEKRYFAHPIYSYDVWRIVDGRGNSKSVLITRDEFAMERKVCKIIDHYGEENDLGKIAQALDWLMREDGEYEYVDVYSYGVPVEIYEQGGFVRCDQSSKNIIPNYFHPFVQKNIALKMPIPVVEGAKLFRGDGDQDRPC